MEKISRRQFLKISLLTAASASLAACGGVTSSQETLTVAEQEARGDFFATGAPHHLKSSAVGVNPETSLPCTFQKNENIIPTALDPPTVVLGVVVDRMTEIENADKSCKTKVSIHSLEPGGYEPPAPRQ